MLLQQMDECIPGIRMAKGKMTMCQYEEAAILHKTLLHPFPPLPTPKSCSRAAHSIAP